jgi:CO dehydrogenase maturation factor
MEAGIEHLGRATASSIDKMIIIVEPGSRSISTAKTIMRMAKEIAIQSFVIVGNKLQDEKQKEWISKKFSQDQILGMISYHEIIRDADLLQQPLIELLDEKLKREFEKIYQAMSLDL